MKKWITQANGINVIRVLKGRCACYLIEKGGICALVDTSVTGERNALLDQLDRLGIRSLDYILLTHSHFDHTGNACFLQQRHNSKVFIHSSEKAFISEGYSFFPKGTTPATKLLSLIIGKKVPRFMRFDACDKESIITEVDASTTILGDLCIQIMSAPGHTTGSVSFIVDNEIAIAGDTMIRRASQIYPPFADYPELLPDAWKQLLATPCRLFLPSHGDEIARSLLESSLTISSLPSSPSPSRLR